MISSVTNPKIKKYAKLQMKKYREKSGLFLLDSKNVIEEVLKTLNLIDIYSLDDTYTKVSPHVMKKLVGYESKVCAVAKKPETKTISDKVLVCENIQDPGNLGTLLRSALAFGFKDIIIIDSVDVFSPKVVRSSEGALLSLNIIIVSKEETLNKLKNHALLVTGLNHQSLSLPKKPFALVLGNEGRGVSETFFEKASQIVTIQTSHVESLNVAMAGTILMHQMKDC